jgi:hypothetical protein
VIIALFRCLIFFTSLLYLQAQGHSNSPPGKIDNARFICHHGKSIPPSCIHDKLQSISVRESCGSLACDEVVSHNEEIAPEFDVDIVRASTWLSLQHRHKGGPAIQLSVCSNGTVLFSPDVCEACQAIRSENIARRKREFKNDIIHVKILQSDEPIPTHECNAAQDGPRNVRRSSRKRKSSKDKCFDMVVNSFDTVGMLKLKILEKKVSE